MGLLDALKQYVSDSMPGGLLNPEWNKANGQRLAEELNRGLLESTGINARDKRRAWERNKLDAVSGSSDTKASLNQQAYDSAMAMAGMAPMGLTVWHGSPHKFSKFDMSKIGTGEGAQAYGHGLYMAETPDVAQTYKQSADWRQKTMDQMRYLVDGKEVMPKGVDDGLLYHYRMSAPDLFAERIQHLEKQKAGSLDQAKYYAEQAKLGDDPERYARMAKRAQETARKFDEELQLAAKLQNQKVEAATGSLYKVDIPDEAVARMLDWDKPLSQQAPEVQKAIIGAAKNSSDPWINGWARTWEEYPNATGQEIYRSIANRLGNQESLAFNSRAEVPAASNMLQQAGVPGIRYLDAGSRAGGQGTSNYVLFSDQLPRILEVNGKPTGQTPWAAGEWKGLLGQ